MEKKILKELFDYKLQRILEVLVNNNKEYYLSELAKDTNVSTASTYRILKRLEQLRIVKVRKIIKFKLYSLYHNDTTSFLSSLFLNEENALDVFVARLSEWENISAIVLQGKKEEYSANILLIGSNIDIVKVDQIVQELKEKNNYEISFVSLDKDQYVKMTSMGLYSGKKEILFSRK